MGPDRMSLPTLALGLGQPLVLGRSEAPLLQRFFEENPSYFTAVEGRSPGKNAGLKEIDDEPPTGWTYTSKWVLGFAATPQGPHAQLDPRASAESRPGSAPRLWAMASIIADLLAPSVWHVGLFMVSTSLHGSGRAAALYASLESWMRSQGARWLRLGVVAGNERALSFWRRQGYERARLRVGVPMGKRVQTVLVMYKALAAGSASHDYFALVPRDRPDGP